MRLYALAVSLALTMGTIEAHADLITFNMTGTITQISSPSFLLPVTWGDRVGWTLQFDRSSLPTSTGSGGVTYSPNSPTILNVIDLTTNTPLPSPLLGSSDSRQSLSLFPGYLSGGQLTGVSTFAVSTQWWTARSLGEANLELESKYGLPSLTNLANLQLNKLPFEWGTLHYVFAQNVASASRFDVHRLMVTSFDVRADPLSAPVSPVPEPGSLTLLVLGVVGVAARPLRTKFERAGRQAREICV